MFSVQPLPHRNVLGLADQKRSFLCIFRRWIRIFGQDWKKHGFCFYIFFNATIAKKTMFFEVRKNPRVMAEFWPWIGFSDPKSLGCDYSSPSDNLLFFETYDTFFSKFKHSFVKIVNLLSKSESVKFSLNESVNCLFTVLSVKNIFHC